MNYKIVNFEISNSLYRRVKAYADFFCMNKNSLMQMLVVVGVQEYYEGNIKQIRKTNVAKDIKKELNEVTQKISSLELSKDFSNGSDKDNFEKQINYLKNEERAELFKKKNTLSTRCKVTISMELYEKIDCILKEQKSNDKSLCKSDIICDLIKFSLDKHLKYLEEIAPYELNVRDRRVYVDRYQDESTVQYTIETKIPNEEKNKGKKRKIKRVEVKETIPEYIPLNEESYWRNNEKISMSFDVPKVFYDFLTEQADKFNVKPDDYVKILIESEFSEWKKQ